MGPVRLVEPFGAGGGPDLLARELAAWLAVAWGRPVVVENVPGEGSTAAPALVAQSPADGHTLLINTSAHAYVGAVAHDLPYHPLEDFTPVAPLTEQAYVFVTGRESGIVTLHDLVTPAAARPAELTFGSTGAGTASHLAAALLNLEAGVTAVHVLPGPGDSIVEVVAKVAAWRHRLPVVSHLDRQALPEGGNTRRARRQHRASLAVAPRRAHGRRTRHRRLRLSDLVRGLGARRNVAGHRPGRSGTASPTR